MDYLAFQSRACVIRNLLVVTLLFIGWHRLLGHDINSLIHRFDCFLAAFFKYEILSLASYYFSWITALMRKYRNKSIEWCRRKDK